MSSVEISTISPALSNLVAYYRFESGALTTDSSGNGRTLTAIGDPALGTGKFGGCADFDGNDSYYYPYNSAFNTTGSFTVGAWVKTSTTGTNMFIISKYMSGDSLNKQFSLYKATTNYAQFTIYTTNESGYLVASGTTNIANGNWHFVVGSHDHSNSRIDLYVDGVLEATDTTPNGTEQTSANAKLTIGVRQHISTDELYWTGSLDDVFMLNGTALSAEQIKGIYLGWKKRNGVSNVDIKTINGVAIDSVKSYNGI